MPRHTMRITDVRVLPVKSNFTWNLVRVDTDAGLVGYGEAYWGAGVANLISELKERYVGLDPTNPEPVYQEVYRSMIASGSTGGTLTTAVSGIEMATWDLFGKATGLPLYRLLGGMFREKILIYADCHAGDRGTDEPDDFADKARRVKALGFKALKFDLDFACYDRFSRKLRPEEFKHASVVAQAVKSTIGEDAYLAFDCHWRFSVSDAVKLAKLMESYNLMWLEDPVPPENVDALLKVSRASSTPICSGENNYTRFGMKPLIQKQAIDIVSPDIPKVGGIVEGKKIADLADLYYIDVAPHNVSSPIGTIAAVHLCASIPNFLALEFHALDVPLWGEMLKGGCQIEGSYIQVPKKPGLGVDINKKPIADYIGEAAERFFG